LAQDGGLIVEVGAREGTLMAFDKRTGRQLWASEATDPAGHTGGPVPISVEGVPCVAVLDFEGLLVARTDRGHEGETVATYPWRTEFANSIATPAVEGNVIILTSGYNQSRTCALRITRDGAEVLWEQPVYSKTCSPVIHQGRVYWSWRNLVSLNFSTGELEWQHDGFGDAGSCIITADGRLIVLSDRGAVSLFQLDSPSNQPARQLARLENLFASDAWPHVVLAHGQLFVKDRMGELICFGLGAAP
jgi:outer membrane protein assembly factor BamB